MSAQTKRAYEFGRFRIDVGERVLLCEDKPVSLTPKAFDVLMLLIESSGRIVEKDELMNRVWADSFVEEGNLKVTVSMLRKVLEEGAGERQFIETVPRRGYRFVAPVTEAKDESYELVVAEHTQSRIVIEQTEAQSLATDDGRSDRTGWVLALTAGTRRRTVLLALACVGGLVLAVAVYFWITASSRPELGASNVKSIAVLPFKPLISDQRDEFLELGMADALITKLSNIREIMVRPTSAVLKYSDGKGDPLAAGREQGVDAVLEGSVQRSGDRIRVTVQLVRVSDGKPLWADKFDEKSTDRIFSVQDSISQQVARALVPRLTGEEQQRLAKRYTDNTEAYNLYLKGYFFWNRFDEDGLKKAVEYFNQAVAMDPDYALAYAGLADAYNVQGAMGIVPPAQTWSKAKWAAEKAVELDDTLAKSHQALGAVKLLFEWDWSGAERELTRAIELNPTDADTHDLYAYYFQATGQMEKGLSEIRRAQELAPLSLIINTDVASALYYHGDYDEAIRVYRKTAELDPHFPAPALFVLAQIYERKGEPDMAIAECQKAFSSFGRDPAILAVLGYTYAVSGRRRDAQKILAEIEAIWARRYFSPIDVALIHAGLGDKNAAFAWLTKAYEARDPQLIWIRLDPELESLHTDPRFMDLLRRMNLVQ